MKNTKYFVQAKFPKAIEFVKDKNFDGFLFEIDFVKSDNKFKEIDRFLWESRKSQGYVNRYEGKVIINLTKWASKEPNDYLNAFLYLLEDYGYEICFICEKNPGEKLINAVKEHFDLEIKDMLNKTNKNERKTRRIGFIIEEDNDVRE